MEFSIVGPQDAERAHQWHLGFAAANQSILPRTETQFRELIEEGYVWSASEQRNYAGLAYCCPNQECTEWELGGLMVAAREANQGIAAILARLALTNVLVKENPVRRGERVIDTRARQQQRASGSHRESSSIPVRQARKLPIQRPARPTGERARNGRRRSIHYDQR
jgi:hypothetical protein